ncbi:MAG: hypothetical protein ACLTMP_09880 [Eggerthella lenta]
MPDGFSAAAHSRRDFDFSLAEAEGIRGLARHRPVLPRRRLVNSG